MCAFQGWWNPWEPGTMKDGRILQIEAPIEILMRPANEYVSKFVSGVSRLHILIAAHVMDREHDLEGAPGTHHGNRHFVKDIDSLADLLSTAVDSGLPLSVKDADGSVVGVITEKSLLRGLSTHRFTSSDTAAE